jgi:preprotein translocase subunit SecA
MLKTVFNRVFGTRFARELKRIQPIIDAIKEHEARLGPLPEEAIRGQTAVLRAKIRERTGPFEAELAAKKQAKHDTADPAARERLDQEIRKIEEDYRAALRDALSEVLPEAFATVREVCRRLKGTKVVVTGHELEWDMVPYDVQLIGGIVLHEGKIAEMATGEGKTLVATLPMYLNALAGRGAQLVTVNNYLARRDSQWMGHLYQYLGLTVGCIDETEPSSAERHAAYRCDITYGTNNEFGFDYLRDNMVFSLDQRVQREHYYAIIDEVDSILVDEARTPLIISGPVGSEDDRKYAQYNTQVTNLVRRQSNTVNELLARGEKLLEEDPASYDAAVALYKARLGGPKNKKLLKLLQESGVQQLVQQVELDHIGDRKLPARDQRLRDVEEDLLYVLDERGHSVHLTDKGVEAMSPGDPGLFVIPDISEAIGAVEHDEALSPEDRIETRRILEAEYAEKSEKLHIIHKLLQAHALYEKDVEYVVQEGQVFIVDEFTGRILPGRRWSDGLHQAVEAKEGVTVRGETQTLATITIQNYFRMYDKLAGMTGTAETEETEFFQIYGLDVMVIPTNRPVRRVDDHDRIYRTRREKYNAIIDEVVRQHERGLPVLVGTTSVEISETLSRMLKRRGLKHEVLNAKHHQREAEIVSLAGRAGAITIATNMAGRGTDIKLGPNVRQCQACGITARLAPFGQQIEKPDLSKQEIAQRKCQEEPPCGLVIVGTERHESRRIDRQLRGRSGRQGDPGQSVFFLSLEDDLMRLFISDRVAKWMDSSGVEEGEVITHPLVTRAIENAQKKVELRNFQARKRLLDYDDVMNQQREVVYSLRLFALEGGEELKAEASRMLDQAAARFAAEMGPDDADTWDRHRIAMELMVRYLVSARDIEDPGKVPDAAALEQTVRKAVQDQFQAKLTGWTELGRRHGVADLADRLLAHVMLQVLDDKWKDHLYDLDLLRNAIQYRAWGQKDPLIEYKQEAFDMFVDLMHDVRASFMDRFFKFQVQLTPSAPARPVPRQPPVQTSHPAASDEDLMVGATGTTGTTGSTGVAGSTGMAGPRRVAPGVPAVRGVPATGGGRPLPKVGRNDPCPCGSGKKYKKCHGVES